MYTTSLKIALSRPWRVLQVCRALRNIDFIDDSKDTRGTAIALRRSGALNSFRARADIQKQIAEVSLAREQFLREVRAQSAGGKQALDEAVIDALRTQAKAKGFKFD